MARRLVALSLVVPDYDAGIAYYTGPMGFDLVEDIDMGGGKRWVVVAPEGGGTQFVLAKAKGPQQEAAIGNQGGGRVWLFLETDDFMADYERMTAAGVDFEEDPRHEPYGVVAVFRDGFGNRWDLLQRSANS